LYEAVKNGNEQTMDVLLKHHAKLCMSESLAASTLCQLVFDGDSRFGVIGVKAMGSGGVSCQG
jgi:hypothetical protein